MKRLIVQGNSDIRKGAVIEYDGEEFVCFSVTRNGDYHGPEEPQLWCVVGSEDEYEDFEKRNFTPHFLDVESIDADAVTVVRAEGDLAA